MYYPMYFDPTYILIIIGVLLSLAASTKVKSTFSRYSGVRSLSGLTGAQTAERILHQAGIYDVGIARISGDLTDHYDPSSKTLRLSDSVYGSNSVAAVSVAAHECGHAIQHQENYAPLKIRAALVPVANFGAGIQLAADHHRDFTGRQQSSDQYRYLAFCGSCGLSSGNTSCGIECIFQSTEDHGIFRYSAWR